MAKGLPIHTGDPNIEQGTFEKLPDVIYRVNGINKIISVDEKGDPIFKLQNGRLVLQFEFRSGINDPGPACSASPAEFWALAGAMGAELPEAAQATSSQAITRAVDQINRSGKSLSVESANGWVNANRIPGATPPIGKYTVRLARVHRPDFAPDTYDFQHMKSTFDATDYETLVFDFEIVGLPNGKPSLYDGYLISLFMNNPFTDTKVEADGKIIRAVDVGTPLWARDPRNNGIPIHVRRWETFITYFCPEAREHDWQVDPAKSEYGVCEVLQPQYVFINEALKAGRRVNVYYKAKTRGKGNFFDMLDIPYENDPNTLPPVEVTPQASAKQPVQLLDLITYIEQRWPEANIFDNSVDDAVVFSAEGRAWAKEYLLPAWIKAGLDATDRKPLHKLTADEVTRLLEAFKNLYPLPTAEPGW